VCLLSLRFVVFFFPEHIMYLALDFLDVNLR